MIRTRGVIRPDALRTRVVSSTSPAVSGSSGCRTACCGAPVSLSTGIAMFSLLLLSRARTSLNPAGSGPYIALWERCLRSLFHFGLFGKEPGALVQNLGSARVEEHDNDDPQHKPGGIYWAKQVASTARQVKFMAVSLATVRKFCTIAERESRCQATAISVSV